jgi:hypothetical protein
MMFAGLPDGFTFGKGESAYLVGQTWFVTVYYRKRPAFDMVKDYDLALDRERYLALRCKSKDWQEFPSLREMVLVMCTKHRMGVE